MTVDNGKINRVRLEALEEDFKEIKKSIAANTVLLYKTREEVAGLRAEQRIIGGFMIVAIGALIAVVISQAVI